MKAVRAIVAVPLAALGMLWASVSLPDCVGCDNPVFRYALQNWSPAEYELLLLKAGELNETEAAAWEIAQAAVAQKTPRINLRPRQATIAELNGAAKDSAYQQAQAAAHGNTLALISPARLGERQLLWSGPCSGENARRILHSPARAELTRRLLAGEAVVWIMLASSDQAANAAAQSLLDSFLASYSKSLALAEEQAAAETAQRAAIPALSPPLIPPVAKSEFWPPRFSTLKIAADDPHEAVLISMLKRSFELPLGNEPLVFAVFGQGRVLGGLPAAELNPMRLRSACDFLTGACSCEAKEKNPGDDLLLLADWGSVAPPPETSGLIFLPALEPAMSANSTNAATLPAANDRRPAPATANPLTSGPQFQPSSSGVRAATIAPRKAVPAELSAFEPAAAVSGNSPDLLWTACGAAALLLLAGYFWLGKSS